MIILLLIFIAVAILISNLAITKWDAEIIGGASAVFAALAGLCLIVCGFISFFAYSGAGATLAEYQITRESLVYQLENNLYDNDNDLGKKELYNQITEYNVDIATGRRLSKQFLTKCFYPDIYYDLEVIELKTEY